MDSPVASPASSLALPAALPGWALPCGREPDALAAAFAAGIALKSLDDLVRSAPIWAGWGSVVISTLIHAKGILQVTGNT